MKKSILTCTILCATLISFGQITAIPDTFYKSGLPSDLDIEFKAHFVNTSDQPIDLLWGKRLNSAPGIWWSWVCDPNRCYLNETLSCPENTPNPILPGDTIEMSMHVKPWNVEGTGTFILNLFDTLGNDYGAVIGYYTVSLTSAVDQAGFEANMVVVPNPAQDYFYISEIPENSRIEVIDVTGRLLRAFDDAKDKSIYIGDLNPGLLLVRISDSTGRFFKTIRLNKQ